MWYECERSSKHGKQQLKHKANFQDWLVPDLKLIYLSLEQKTYLYFDWFDPFPSVFHSPDRGDRNRLPLQTLQPPNCIGVRWCLQNPMQVTRPFSCGCNLDPFLPQKGVEAFKPKIYGKKLYYNGFWFSILGDVKLPVEIFVELVGRFVCVLSPKILQPELYRKAVLIFERWDFFSTFNHGISLRQTQVSILWSCDQQHLLGALLG